MTGKTFEELKISIDEKVNGINDALSVLKESIKCLGDRSVTYDAPGGERSMAKTVDAFNVIHGTNLTEVQGWQFMEMLKMVRSTQGAFKADNYVDAAAYAALACEAASKSEKAAEVKSNDSAIPSEFIESAKNLEWAKYIGIVSAGAVYAFDSIPSEFDFAWDLSSVKRFEYVGSVGPIENWKDSLVEIKRD